MYSRPFIVSVGIFLFCNNMIACTNQYGPEPWHYESNIIHKSDANTPPDLQNLPMYKKQKSEATSAPSDWFFKRIIAILLNAGQFKRHEDNTVEISLHMKFPEKQWNLLNEYKQYTDALPVDILRRTVDYVEEAIYKPSITDIIVQTWGEYIHMLLTKYKTEINWTLVLCSIAMIIWYFSHRISHRHILLILFLGIYAYEIYISYMESEKEEYENFKRAINRCKWYFWSSTCDVPHPDPLVLLKHMHPLKIGIRIFTTLITEPMLIISSTIQTMVHGLTDELWYPLNHMFYGILIVIFNACLVFILIMVIFNFILNTSFNLSFCGLINLNVGQRIRTLFSEPSSRSSRNDEDKLSGKNLQNLLNFIGRHGDGPGNHVNKLALNSTPRGDSTAKSIKRSSSTGRLTDLVKMNESCESSTRYRHKNCGGGDS